MSHSPGPWRYDSEAPSDIVYDARGTAIWIGAVGFGANADDARLIAAAPQLLAGLKEIRKNTFFMGIQSGNATCSMTPEVVAMVDALIASIEGEP